MILQELSRSTTKTRKKLKVDVIQYYQKLSKFLYPISVLDKTVDFRTIGIESIRFHII